MRAVLCCVATIVLSPPALAEDAGGEAGAVATGAKAGEKAGGKSVGVSGRESGGASGGENACDASDCTGMLAVHDRWDRARRLRYGYGMTADAAQAFRWYERAAEGGDARAMHNAGLMLVRGQGVERDVGAGRAWLRRSLAANALESALALAELARLGIGEAVDHERAATLYRRAADGGDVRAMHALGNLNARGLGVRRSAEAALFWYLLASDKGHANAMEAARALRTRLDADAVAEAEFRATQWRTTPR